MIEPRLPRPKLREEFRRELRARLMTEAVTALAPRPRGTAWTFLRPALAVGIASLVLVGGAGVAAAGSLPGDLTFGLKRAVLDQVQQKLENEKAREAIERAKDEEDRDTHDEQNKKGLDPRSTPRPTRTPARETARPNATPRVTESPRSGERTASPRATSR